MTLAICLPALGGQGQSFWTEKAPITGAVGRFWAAAFSAGGKGYAGTGRTGFSGNPTQDFWEYDPTSDTWAQIADYPAGVREGCAAFSTPDKGYVGFGTSFIAFNSDLYEYDPTANTWTALPACAASFAYSHGFVLDSLIYIGPENGTNKMWAYNINQRSWGNIADYPGLDRRAQVAFAADGKGYIGLGFWVFGSVQKNMYSYDPATDTWTEVASMDRASDQSTAFSVGKYGYVYNVGGNLKETYRYDAVNDAWVFEASLPGDRIANASAFSIGDKGYVVFGEATISGGNLPSNKLFEFTPDSTLGTSIGSRLHVAPLQAWTTAPGAIQVRRSQPTNAHLVLRDVSGREIARRDWHSATCDWQVQVPAAGLYLLYLVEQGQTTALRKLYLVR
ncbi:MAG: hypothetical protein OHK0039_03360 [Bacteroidia bacterium]